MSKRLRHGCALGIVAALTIAPSADAATTVGADLSRVPNQYAGCVGGASTTCAVVITGTHDANGTSRSVSVPFDGVIVRARARPGSGATGSARVRVAHAAGGNAYKFVASSDSIAAPGTDDVVTVPQRIPVVQGDVIAFDGTPGSVVGSVGSPMYTDPTGLYFEPSPADGSTAAPNASLSGADFLFNVDVEPDGDHDGYGDETQDKCPEDAAFQGPCQADFEAKLVAPSSMPVGALVNYSVVVRNLGPDGAKGLLTVTDTLPAGLAFVSATSAAPGTCEANGPVVTCKLTASAFPKGAAMGLPVNITAKPAGPGDYANSAQIASDNDPNSANDTSSAVTRVEYAPGRCANPQTGTNLADVMNGTAAGDLLHGLLGNDTLTGLAGDDCLFGDIGADSLDGGPGNDALIGGRGNDRLKGGPGNDIVDGDGGNDQLAGGPGKDTVSGGTGNDTIDTRDRTRDRVDCGKGKDKVRADKKDKLVGCERVKRR